MRRDILIAHVTKSGAWLQEQRSRTEVYATSPLHLAGIPMRADISVDVVIGICEALDIPIPAEARQRRRRAKVIKKSKMVLDVPPDAIVLVIPRGAARTGKRGGAGRGRKRNSRS